MSGLAVEARRLSLAAAVTRHVVGRLGETIALSVDAAALVAAARSLAEGADEVERRHRIRFNPPYPGLVAGPASGGALRLLLACGAQDSNGKEIGTVFTTLIAGRRPSVSVAPPEAVLGEGWRELEH